MKWLELSVEAPREFVEPLSEVFRRYGHGGVAAEELGGHNPDERETPPDTGRVVVKTYVPLDSSTEERRSRIDVGVRLIAQLAPVSPLHERLLEEKDWQRAWRQHARVLRIGKRVVVVPTWRKYQPKPLDVVIVLDPGMAFGTGHHPTTRMCLELLEETINPGMDVLDVGSGSGILAIAAARLGARNVLALETNPTAVEAAVSNLRANRVGNTARAVHGTLPHREVASGSWDLVVANISSTVISELAPELVAALKPGGTLIASGILLDKKSAVEQRLRQEGAHVHRNVEDGDWVTQIASTP